MRRKIRQTNTGKKLVVKNVIIVTIDEDVMRANGYVLPQTYLQTAIDKLNWPFPGISVCFQKGEMLKREEVPYRLEYLEKDCDH